MRESSTSWTNRNCSIWQSCFTEGIALHAAHRALLVEPDWTAVVNEQLGNRVLDIGRSARRCVAEMIALSSTLDEVIVQRNVRELHMLSQVGLGRAA